MKLFLALFLILFLFQAPPLCPLGQKPEFIITGTSTLHDWEMSSIEAKGAGKIDVENGRITNVSNLTVSVTANSLTSGKQPMDKNAHKALKANQYPVITFQLIKLKELKQTADKTLLSVAGNLSIAGVTRMIDMEVVGYMHDNMAHFDGQKSIRMSDYNIEPPSFMFGRVKTGDEITVKFKVFFDLNNK